jgi:hypothetical protein
MGIETIIGGAASIFGGMAQADAASEAADMQAGAAREANATQRYMYDTTRADNAPFLNNGVNANNKLAFLLGLSPSPGSSSAMNMLASPSSRAQLTQQLRPQFTTGGPSQTLPDDFRALVAQATADGVPYGYSPDAGNNATLWRDPAGGQTVDTVGLNAEVERLLAQQQSQSQGQFSANSSSSDPNFGFLLRRFGMSDLKDDVPYQVGMQFGLDEGTKGIQRMAAANGGADNGAILKALSRFGNDYGNQQAGAAYNRFTNDQGNIYNRLAGMSGTGQTAVGQVGAAGANYANNVSQNQIGVGNARAASAIGGANALAGGFTGAYNGYQQNKLMEGLLNRNPGGSTGGFMGGALSGMTNIFGS